MGKHLSEGLGGGACLSEARLSPPGWHDTAIDYNHNGTFNRLVERNGIFRDATTVSNIGYSKSGI